MHHLMSSEISSILFNFRDYIQVKYGVELIIRDDHTEHGLPITRLFIDENHPQLAEILKERDECLKKPFDDLYTQASWQSGVVAKQPHSKERSFLGKFIWGYFTLFITAFCILVYALQWLSWERDIFLLFHYPADSSQDHEIWRYFSHSLVHLSPWHILFNLGWWWIFANEIERHFGSLKLILLYFAAAIISGITQNYFSGYGFFGLSGVVYAVLGYVFIQDKVRHQFNLPQGFFSTLLVGIGLGFVSPYFGVSMGNAAHISGLIVGVLFGYLDRSTAKSQA